MMTSSTSDNRSAPEDPKIDGRMVAAHREIDELRKLRVINAKQASQLEKLLTRERIEQHDQDGMSVSDMIDMYRDLISP